MKLCRGKFAVLLCFSAMLAFVGNACEQVSKPLRPDYAQQGRLMLGEAGERVVLLKNRANLLPLKNVGKIFLTGPLQVDCTQGKGGDPTILRQVSSLANALQQTLSHSRIVLPQKPRVDICKNVYMGRGGKTAGLKVAYFNNATLGGLPLYEKSVAALNFDWGMNSPDVEELGRDYFSARYTGFLRVPKTDDYTLVLTSEGGSRMWLDDDLIIDNWGTHERRSAESVVHLQRDQDYEVTIEYSNQIGKASLNLGCRMSDAEAFGKQLKDCDAVIVLASVEGDRHDEDLSCSRALTENQSMTIKMASRQNKPVVVVLSAHGAVDINSWLDDVASVVYLGSPERVSDALLAKILAGEVNPSGKLNFCWTNRASDDALLDERQTDALFPLGFGLSYTHFAYSDLKVNRKGSVCKVKVHVKNIGRCRGTEVVQVYVQPQKAVVGSEPGRILGGVGELTLKPGERKSLTINLDEKIFSTYNPKSKKRIVNAGIYKVEVGSSSRDICLSSEIQVKR